MLFGKRNYLPSGTWRKTFDHDKSIWAPRIHVTKSDNGYQAQLVGNMGETVENFMQANATIHVTGDLEQYKKGKKIKVKLLDERYPNK